MGVCSSLKVLVIWLLILTKKSLNCAARVAWSQFQTLKSGSVLDLCEGFITEFMMRQISFELPLFFSINAL